MVIDESHKTDGREHVSGHCAVCGEPFVAHDIGDLNRQIAEHQQQDHQR